MGLKVKYATIPLVYFYRHKFKKMKRSAGIDNIGLGSSLIPYSDLNAFLALIIVYYLESGFFSSWLIYSAPISLFMNLLNK